MSTDYNAQLVEQKWQKKWQEERLFSVELVAAKKPFYSLVMFPYPSGDKLHVGHWFNYGPADSYARFKRLQGHDVFSPIGFDAFGLPAENYAIKTGMPPAQSTQNNVKTMIAQLSRIGCMYDWDKMVNTTEPDYYLWTQWLFLEMFKNKLAYKKLGNVNFCPSCQTVLANEQVKDGKCERCGTDVLQKPLEQWFWKITDYSEQLLDGLKDLDWPEKTKIMQRNWIGKSEGAEVIFDVENSSQAITVFTTRVDTIFSAAFVVLAPEHPLVKKITTDAQSKAVEKYLAEVAKKTEIQRTDTTKEKTGVFTGSFVINPANGEKIPVWVADFVLAHYGHGAVFGDAHDERDFVFAKKYEIPIRTTIQPESGDDADVRALITCFSGDGILYNSGEFDGLTSAEARTKIGLWLQKKGKGKPIINYRLRDWLISRQRYWGAPIPVVYDPEGNAHPVPEEHLPWLLPTDVEFKPTGKSPLTESKEFIARTEKIFGKGWRPEFDTMDTFVCSSFYYLRYLMEGDKKQLIDPDLEKKWLPVSMYIGGAEHACMHLIYARFVMMALHDFGYVQNKEPFKKLVHQGTVTNKGAKMSKSKGNVVSPDAFVEQYGSDVFRMYLMFMGPFEAGGDWSDTGIKGIVRFIDRLWKILSSDKKIAQDSEQVLAALHRTIKKVTEDIEELHFNTAISALMELLNAIEKVGECSEVTAKTIAILIAPLAPHFAEEVWASLGGNDFAIEQTWPVYDPALLVESTMTIVIQVNGKIRGELSIPRDTSKEEILLLAKANTNVQKFIASGIKKELYVPEKLVSLVV